MVVQVIPWPHDPQRLAKSLSDAQSITISARTAFSPRKRIDLFGALSDAVPLPSARREKGPLLLTGRWLRCDAPRGIDHGRPPKLTQRGSASVSRPYLLPFETADARHGVHPKFLCKAPVFAQSCSKYISFPLTHGFTIMVSLVFIWIGRSCTLYKNPAFSTHRSKAPKNKYTLPFGMRMVQLRVPGSKALNWEPKGIQTQRLGGLVRFFGSHHLASGAQRNATTKGKRRKRGALGAWRD